MLHVFVFVKYRKLTPVLEVVLHFLPALIFLSQLMLEETESNVLFMSDM